MKLLRTAVAFFPLSVALSLVATAPSAAAQSTGWIRWGNWSPSAPAFDIYLNSFGDPHSPTVIKHVRYGHVSSYTAIPTGQYTIAMRDSGAAATAPPTLSASVQVAQGTAYTIVSMGPASHLGVQVLKETMNSHPGKALVRVIQESLKQHSVTVTDGGRTLGGHLLLGKYTGYLPVSPGWQAIHAAGYSESTTKKVFLRANTIHTLVVLDAPGGLRIHNLKDAVGSKTMPAGGAATGLGGTAPRAPGSSPMPWLAAIAGGGLFAAVGAIRLRRARHRAAHAVISRLRTPAPAGQHQRHHRRGRTHGPFAPRRVYAARSYSLIRPPRTGLRLIRSWERSAAGWPGRGGYSWRPRWGRRPL